MILTAIFVLRQLDCDTYVGMHHVCCGLLRLQSYGMDIT